MEGKSLEEINAAAVEEQGWAMVLQDINPRADVEQLFQRWRGEFRLVRAGRTRSEMICFNTQAQLREALAAFGGGLRGQFRVDRRSTLGETDCPRLCMCSLLMYLAL